MSDETGDVISDLKHGRTLRDRIQRLEAALRNLLETWHTHGACACADWYKALADARAALEDTR